jgi:hypothetical protein
MGPSYKGEVKCYEAGIIGHHFAGPALAESALEILRAGADLIASQLFGNVAEGGPVNLGNTNMSAEAAEPIANFDEVTHKITAVVVIAIGHVPVAGEPDAGGLPALQELIEQVVIAILARQKLGSV